MRRVTLPLALPAILGGLIICFLEAIALFASPAMIAIPARFNVATTQLFQFFGNPVRVEVAAAYAMPLLGVTVMLILVQRLMTHRKGFVSLTGKGGERRPIELGRWRWAMFGYAMFVATLSVFLPYLFLLQAAFAKAWGRGFSLDNLSLRNFHFVLFEHATAAQSVINAFLFAGAAATAGVIITLGVAYIVTRRLVPFSGVLGFLCIAPFVIPGVVLAIGFYAAYAPPPLALYGTALILILAFTTRFLPIGYVNNSAAMRSINPEMEEAVRILGGNRITALRRVVAPLLKRSLLGAWLLIFIPATRELSSAIFLYGPGTKVVSVMIFDMSEEGNFEYLAALALLLQVADPAAAVDRPARARAGLHAEAQRDMSKLVLSNITKSFGAFEAVKELSLELQKGEFVSLLGPSGCGKTTTLRMIAGFMPPTSGTIELDGQTISTAFGRRAAGKAAHVDDLPELRHLAEHDGRRECRLRPAGPQTRQRRDRPPGRQDPRRRADARR